jgi:hypothetical protein
LGHEGRGAIIIGCTGDELRSASVGRTEGIPATLDVINDITVARTADTILGIPAIPVMNRRGIWILHMAYEAVTDYPKPDNWTGILRVAVEAAVIGVNSVIARIVIYNRRVG